LHGKENGLRIESSVTGMESERSYSAVSYSARSFRGTLFGKSGGSAEAPATGTGSEEAAGKPSASIKDIMKDMMLGKHIPDGVGDVRYVNGSDDHLSTEGQDARTDIYAGKMSALYIFSILFEEFRDRIREMMAGIRNEYEGTTDMSGESYRIRTRASGDADGMAHTYYREEESTSFKAHGKARCSDGREIDFDINVGMSRSFEKVSKKKLNFNPVNCMDPLVINLNEGVTSLSDRYIYFDLDGDGEEERIKSLSEKSGYIALDKNGDGIINDGAELFGTASGNGFADLAVYDSDGDGWIDEDDEIFDKLKVWIRNTDGTDTLLSFKDAGVGAINLANLPTEYSIKDKNNMHNAIIRSTGMFLYEDGRAGTVQQIDMVS
jgi:hypothetical protein